MELTKEEKEVHEMTKALGVWAKRNGIRPVDLQKGMGWSYGYAWNMLHEKVSFTMPAWGPFARKFGIPALQEIARIARVDLSGKEENL